MTELIDELLAGTNSTERLAASVEILAFLSRKGALLVAATHYCLRAVENERVFVQLERAKHEQGKLYRAANALAAASGTTPNPSAI